MRALPTGTVGPSGSPRPQGEGTILGQCPPCPQPCGWQAVSAPSPGPGSSQLFTVNRAIFRGLFIIDGKGVLRQITINDLPVGRSVDEALRLVQAFQYTDEHGEGEQIHTFTYSHGSMYAAAPLSFMQTFAVCCITCVGWM